MTRIAGPTRTQLDQAADQYAALLDRELTHTIDLTLAKLGDRFDADDLGVIPQFWGERLDGLLAPTLALALHVGSADIRRQLRQHLGLAAPTAPTRIRTVQPDTRQDNLTAAEALHLPGKHDQKRHGRRPRRADVTIAQLRTVYGDKLHVSDQGHPEVQRNLKDFAALPEEHHKVLADHFRKNDWMPSLQDAGIYFGSGPISSLDKRSDLKTVQPRGWTKGKTWSDVPGAYHGESRQLLIGTGGHGSHSLAHHETGHAIDDAIGGSSSLRYGQVHGQMLNAGAAPYYMQKGAAGRQESFAEAYALWAQHRTLTNSDKYRATEMGLGLGLKSGDAGQIGGRFVDHFDGVDSSLKAIAAGPST